MTEKESNRIKKDYLWSYQPVEKRIRQLDGEIERLRLERDATKAIQYSGMPNGQADRTSPQESYVMALEDYTQESFSGCKSHFFINLRMSSAGVHIQRSMTSPLLQEYAAGITQ